MTRFALTPYALALHRAGDAGSGPLEERAALDAVAAVLGEGEALVDTERARVLRVTRLEQDRAALRLWGIVEAGTFGEPAELYDVRTGEETERSATQAEMTPFYLLADFASRPALVLLQRCGALGVKTQLDDALRRGLERLEPPLALAFEPWPAADAALRYLRAGGVRTVRLRREGGVPAWIPGLEGGGAALELRVELGDRPAAHVVRSLERLLVPGRPAVVDDLLAALGAADGPLAAVGFDEASLTLAHGDATRRVDLGHPEAFDADIPLDDEIVAGPDGHPTFASLHRAGLRHLEALRSSG